MTPKEPDDENLPSIIPDTINFPQPQALPPNVNENEVVADDLTQANAALQIVHAMWGNVKTISGVKTMMNLTIQAVRFRRDVLGIPYGSQTATAKDKTIFPLD